MKRYVKPQDILLLLALLGYGLLILAIWRSGLFEMLLWNLSGIFEQLLR